MEKLAPLGKEVVFEAVKAAFAEPFVPASRGYGCGRAYVCLSSENDRKTVNAVSAAAKKLGKLFLRKAYGAGNNAIYIGYDNATGRELARSEAIAKALTAKGIPAYSEAVED